jgi:hypothetical protein
VLGDTLQKTSRIRGCFKLQIQVKRNKYYICETAGPGRSNFGYGGDLDGSFYLEEFELKQ